MQRLRHRAPLLFGAVFLLWAGVYGAGQWPDMTTPSPTLGSALVFGSAVAMVLFGAWEFARGGYQVVVAALGYLAAAQRAKPVAPGVFQALRIYGRRLAPGGWVMARAWVYLGMGSLLMNVHKLGGG